MTELCPPLVADDLRRSLTVYLVTTFALSDDDAQASLRAPSSPTRLTASSKAFSCARACTLRQRPDHSQPQGQGESDEEIQNQIAQWGRAIAAMADCSDAASLE